MIKESYKIVGALTLGAVIFCTALVATPLDALVFKLEKFLLNRYGLHLDDSTILILLLAVCALVVLMGGFNTIVRGLGELTGSSIRLFRHLRRQPRNI